MDIFFSYLLYFELLHELCDDAAIARPRVDLSNLQVYVSNQSFCLTITDFNVSYSVQFRNCAQYNPGTNNLDMVA